MDSNNHGMTIIMEDLDPKRTAIVVGPFLGLLSAPIVFQAMRMVDPDQNSIMLDLVASLVTTILCLAYMILINNYLFYNCHLAKQEHHLKTYNQQRSFMNKLLSVFQPTSESATSGNQNSSSSFKFLHSTTVDGGQNGEQRKRKLDPKYFKPKFIINELMTFWGTTCTVITWGSFYVIGGTLVATERIAQKMKTKRTNSRDNSFSNNQSFWSSASSPSPHNRGTGQSESSFLNMSFRSTSNDENNNMDHEQTNNRGHTFRRISSWTKRSYTSIRKRFSRVVTTNVPHRFSSLTSPNNTSNAS